MKQYLMDGKPCLILYFDDHCIVWGLPSGIQIMTPDSMMFAEGCRFENMVQISPPRNARAEWNFIRPKLSVREVASH